MSRHTFLPCKYLQHSFLLSVNPKNLMKKSKSHWSTFSMVAPSANAVCRFPLLGALIVDAQYGVQIARRHHQRTGQFALVAQSGHGRKLHQCAEQSRRISHLAVDGQQRFHCPRRHHARPRRRCVRRLRLFAPEMEGTRPHLFDFSRHHVGAGTSAVDSVLSY